MRVTAPRCEARASGPPPLGRRAAKTTHLARRHVTDAACNGERRWRAPGAHLRGGVALASQRSSPMPELRPAKGRPGAHALAAVAVLCLLLGGVVAGARHLIESDRRQLADRFAADRLAHADEAVELTRRD